MKKNYIKGEFEKEIDKHIDIYNKTTDWKGDLKKASEHLEAIRWLLNNFPVFKEKPSIVKKLSKECKKVEKFVAQNTKAKKIFPRGNFLE